MADFVELQLNGGDAPKPRQSADDPSWWVAKFQQRISGTLKLLDSLDNVGSEAIASIFQSGDASQREQLERLRDQLNQLLGS